LNLKGEAVRINYPILPDFPRVFHFLYIQFIAIAVAEKISALETERFFAERAKQADMNAFRTIFSRPGGEPPRIGGEL
jgi:hypothetical protein